MKRKPLVATNATETVEGPIPHLELFTDAGLVLCPVALVLTDAARVGKLVLMSSARGATYLPTPRRENGRLVYALPGGGVFVA